MAEVMGWFWGIAKRYLDIEEVVKAGICHRFF